MRYSYKRYVMMSFEIKHLNLGEKFSHEEAE